jgi:uncharacterized protein DUF4154
MGDARSACGVGARAALLVALLLASSVAAAFGQSAAESQVKAAFLYNFAKFVEWPSGAFAGTDTPLVIGVVGKDPFGRDLDDVVRGRTAVGRSIVVRRYAASDTLDCHVAFIGTSEKRRLGEILRRLKGTAVLTVSDLDDFIQAGGMIRMFAAAGEIKLEINPDAATSAGLKLSSKLLGAATLVRFADRH